MAIFDIIFIMCTPEGGPKKQPFFSVWVTCGGKIINLHQHDDENTAIFNQPKMSGGKAGTSMVGDRLEKREVVACISMRVLKRGNVGNPRRKRRKKAQRATQTTRWPPGPCSAAISAVNQNLGLVQGKP